METMRTIMYGVWAGVGVTIIAGTIWSIWWMQKFYKGFGKFYGVEEKAE